MSQSGLCWYKELQRTYANDPLMQEWLEKNREELLVSSGILSAGQENSKREFESLYWAEVWYPEEIKD